MINGPDPREETFHKVLSEGNFFFPKPDPNAEFLSREKRAVLLMLWGIGLCIVAPLVHYRIALLALVGSVLLLWSTLRLRKTNHWLGACFVMSVLQIIWRLALLICDSIPDTDLVTTLPMVIGGHVFSVLGLIQMLCIDRGLEIALRGTEISVDRRVAIGMFASYAVLVGLSFAPDTEPILVAKIAVSILCAWLLYKIYHYLE